MMLMAASCPSKRLAAVTIRTGCVGDVQRGAPVMARGYDEMGHGSSCHPPTSAMGRHLTWPSVGCVAEAHRSSSTSTCCASAG